MECFIYMLKIYNFTVAFAYKLCAVVLYSTEAYISMVLLPTKERAISSQPVDFGQCIQSDIS